MSDKPPFLQVGAQARSPQRRIRSGGAGAARWPRCAGVDRGVAQVYNAVKHAGQLGRTVFIFISDNGQFYGEHRIAKGKVLPYEEALHLPLVIKVAEPIPERRSRGEEGAAGRSPTSISRRPSSSFAHADPCPASGAVPDDGRALADAAAEAPRKLAAQPRGADRVPGPAPGQVRDLPVRRDPHPRGDLRGAFAGRRPGDGPVRAHRPGRALRARGRTRSSFTTCASEATRATARRTRRRRISSPASGGSRTAPGSRGGTARGRPPVLRVGRGAAGEPDPVPLLPCRCRRFRLPRKLDSRKQRRPHDHHRAACSGPRRPAR